MYHALVVKQSLKSLSPIKNLEILNKKKDGNWLIYKITIPENRVDDFADKLQKSMDESQEWYMHLYNQDGSSLIIIFRNKIFKTDNNPKNWSDIVKYGESLGIPIEQLDFAPNSFATEKY